MQRTKFENVVTYVAVESVQVGVAIDAGFIALQLKVKEAEFPNLIVLDRSDALFLAAHLTAAVAGMAKCRSEDQVGFEAKASDGEAKHEGDAACSTTTA